ncbi:MAG: ATP-dependent DNA helicase RecG, partial [Deferribacteraceae bacterium]|jgi:ATP-dependent DNA helicase RecG|nr:ATP-dependent DNA helicase RecG [Deferribacteraceae bacterium]
MLGFELPQLREILGEILKDYPGFLKAPADCLSRVKKVADTLPAGSADAILLHLNGFQNSKTYERTALDAFIEELKLFLEKDADAFSIEKEQLLALPTINVAGFGPTAEKALENCGIFTIKSFLMCLPFRYESLTPGHFGGKGVLSGVFRTSEIVYTKQRKRLFSAAFTYEKGYFHCLWLNFSFNFPSKELKAGETYHMYGAITLYNSVPAIFHPEFLKAEDIGGVRPVYSVSAALSQKVYGKAVNTALQKYLGDINEVLPEYIRFRYRFPHITDALLTLHKPATTANADAITNRTHPAFVRFIYEEFFYLQLRILLRKKSYMESAGIAYKFDRSLLDEIAPLMSFKLTKSQKDALRSIYDDMRSPAQMNRLLQGDVGCGKTIVAILAAMVAVKCGFQAVFLAPTEVLAEQHFRVLDKFAAPAGFITAYLSGSTTAKNKREIKSLLADGTVNFLVGTHAVIQDDVQFKNLGFAVIDEQHRFGVRQRKALLNKGFIPDMLLMSATPIPRTLALTYYGDLELSAINEMPPGRIPSITKVFGANSLNAAFAFVKDHLKEGERAYFVYPAIEDSGKSKLKSAVKNFAEVKRRFPDKKAGLLHGKLSATEKGTLLKDFREGVLDILVSTTVVEVGVDIKDATVMFVDNADKFGLAQLHQLRGRVGRSDKQSYCVLVASEELSENGMKRLRAMETTNSGFELAELDLTLRGHGDFLGVKQSGLPEFEYADITKDTAIYRSAREDAELIIQGDPKLESPENKLLKDVLQNRWRDEYEMFLVG